MAVGTVATEYVRLLLTRLGRDNRPHLPKGRTIFLNRTRMALNDRTDCVGLRTGNGERANSVGMSPISPDSLGRVLAVANQKGGVGKTTTAVNLSACFAEDGHRTLLVDLDPQANATTAVGIESRRLEHSMYDVLLHDVLLEDAVEPTALRNLYLAPSHLDLAGAEVELVPAFNRERRLRVAIESVAQDYDIVMIDCPPSLGLLTINALTAAEEVIVPIQTEYFALEGLGQLIRNIDLVQRNLNPDLMISKVILGMYDARTNLSRQVADEVREYFGEKVCEQVVPRAVRLSEAPSHGQPITVYDPKSKGSIAYRALAKEVIGGPS